MPKTEGKSITAITIPIAFIVIVTTYSIPSSLIEQLKMHSAIVAINS